MRRILLLITDLEIGGTPTVVRELAVRLRSDDVEVGVACLKGWGPVADQLRERGVEVTAFGARRGRELLGVAKRLASLVRERGVDTVFSFLVHANVVAALAARRLPGVRFLQSIQTVQPRPRWHWWAQRWAARRAERIIVPSTAIVRVAGERSGIAAEKCVVIPNAVEPGDFPRVAVFGGPRIRAGYLGRLDRAKGPQILPRAIEASDIDDAELHYFGDGRDRQMVEALALGLEKRVYFHGAVASPQEALGRMDVLWLPSCVEGFGLVLIEAMASGVPVVACAAGGVLDVAKDGENGLLVAADANAHRGFAASLRRLRDDRALRERLIENGLRTVRERFSWESVLGGYRRVLGV